MNQQVSAHHLSSNTHVDNQVQQGQFSYHTSPASLWPDFMLGQASQPLRVLLVDQDARLRNVVSQELNQGELITCCQSRA